MELSSSKIKENLIFLEMELSSLIFFLYFGMELSELENFKKKIKKNSEIISYMELSSPNIKKCIFQEGTCKA